MSTADYRIEEGEGGTVLRLSGDWTTTGLGRSTRDLGRELSGQTLTAVDLSELGRFDTAGALAIVQASDTTLPEGAWAERPEAGRVYAMVEKLERESAPPPKRPPAVIRTFAKIGHGVYDIAAEFVLSMAFLGRLILAVGSALRNPGRIRWPAWFSQGERAGLDLSLIHISEPTRPC